MNERKLIETLAMMYRLLVTKRYTDLARLSVEGGMSARQIQEAVEEWPYPLIMPPNLNLATILYDEAVEVADASPAEWSIYLNLWTKEEGRSDLSLEVSVVEDAGERYAVQIQNIHVL